MYLSITGSEIERVLLRSGSESSKLQGTSYRIIVICNEIFSVTKRGVTRVKIM